MKNFRDLIIVVLLLVSAGISVKLLGEPLSEISDDQEVSPVKNKETFNWLYLLGSFNHFQGR
jgi:hypothetical protein